MNKISREDSELINQWLKNNYLRFLSFKRISISLIILSNFNCIIFTSLSTVANPFKRFLELFNLLLLICIVGTLTLESFTTTDSVVEI